MAACRHAVDAFQQSVCGAEQESFHAARCAVLVVWAPGSRMVDGQWFGHEHTDAASSRWLTGGVRCQRTHLPTTDARADPLQQFRKPPDAVVLLGKYQQRIHPPLTSKGMVGSGGDGSSSHAEADEASQSSPEVTHRYVKERRWYSEKERPIRHPR